MLRKTAIRYMERKHFRFPRAILLPTFVTGALHAHTRPTIRPQPPAVGGVDPDARFTVWPTTLAPVTPS